MSATQGEPDPSGRRSRATTIGFGAVLLWAAMALLTVGVGAVPPFLLATFCFTLGGMIGLVWLLTAGGGVAALRGIRPAAYLVGIGGLFGYHFCYFTAIRHAPPAQASLIAYLWPLLIVLLSGLLPGERLRAGHVLGAVVAFSGATLVLVGPGTALEPDHLPGYLAAGACAVIWAAYSVLSRRLGDVPTEAVAVFCLATALLSLLSHLALETTVWPSSPRAWAAVAGLGLGPVGLAFYLWDIGCKRGDIQLLGTASYAAPLLSTLFLILADVTEPSLGLILAALLVAGGALVAARAGRVKA